MQYLYIELAAAGSTFLAHAFWLILIKCETFHCHPVVAQFQPFTLHSPLNLQMSQAGCYHWRFLFQRRYGRYSLLDIFVQLTTLQKLLMSPLY